MASVFHLTRSRGLWASEGGAESSSSPGPWTSEWFEGSSRGRGALLYPDSNQKWFPGGPPMAHPRLTHQLIIWEAVELQREGWR